MCLPSDFALGVRVSFCLVTALPSSLFRAFALRLTSSDSSSSCSDTPERDQNGSETYSSLSLSLRLSFSQKNVE
jgi:hypothetical protein